LIVHSALPIFDPFRDGADFAAPSGFNAVVVGNYRLNGSLLAYKIENRMISETMAGSLILRSLQLTFYFNDSPKVIATRDFALNSDGFVLMKEVYQSDNYVKTITYSRPKVFIPKIIRIGETVTSTVNYSFSHGVTTHGFSKLHVPSSGENRPGDWHFRMFKSKSDLTFV